MSFSFFFNDTATTEIYTLSLHDALPICPFAAAAKSYSSSAVLPTGTCEETRTTADRKSTRLNSSHPSISYAVFCLKKKKKKPDQGITCNGGTRNSSLTDNLISRFLQNYD